MAFTGYRGSVSGAVQTVYTDQPGVAVAGMVAFASENNFLDGIVIGETEGVAAGVGCQFTQNTAAASNLQRPDVSALLPTTGLTAADLKGVLVFDETMQSDSTGVPGYNKGRFGRFLRTDRIGGRIYVKAVEAVAPATASVNWVIVAGSDGKYKAGEFAPAALAGNAAVGYSVAITTAKWVTTAAAGGLAIIEFGLN